ncbi:peptidoglycan-binding protein [Streptomonospora nanhaiensis]|uniref:peptidoglycan recognition protein family protein n=1 Tax=Streptomonospora nanhaiensis TaxID=1323731 RepID=UPI001C388FE5|nr:N-acetylmuramoyl-L-alanine amidase [Streptomonospora nanhaiensis]MBV2364986.1 N-acetylmuramoyl-L-alanine amidase [Streptomonospora nanhaiensis]MBX9391306.1 N-acetylmuramoyl-L-alanine amidase [Streptomonospora nanhaiensis]
MDLTQLLILAATTPLTLGLVVESASTVGIPSVIGSRGHPRSGRVVHYNGGPLTWGSHANCRAQVRQIHTQHRGQGWAGIGYHYLICWHGIVMTGRGLHRVGAHAPGANSTHVGIQFMLGGSQRPSAKQLAAFVAFGTWLAARGVRASVTGHRDWIATSCPGAHLYERIRSSKWGGGAVASPSPAPPFSYWTVAGVRIPTGDPWLLRGMVGVPVRRLQEALKKWRPELLPRYGVDSSFGKETEDAVRVLQRARGITVDGIYGRKSAGELRRALGSSTKPAPTPHGRDPLVADGRLGVLTAKAVQRALKVKADGVWGPVTVRAMQMQCRLRGPAVDGLLGPQTTRAVQRRVGLTGAAVDGVWPSIRAVSQAGVVAFDTNAVSVTTRALQRAVNAGQF